MFITASIAMFAVALLAAVFLWPTRAETSREAAESLVAPEEPIAVGEH